MVPKEIDVSVIMLTYFHEDYIAQALDSVLSQETSLRYEILIGDDASQDRTPEIITFEKNTRKKGKSMVP